MYGIKMFPIRFNGLCMVGGDGSSTLINGAKKAAHALLSREQAIRRYFHALPLRSGNMMASHSGWATGSTARHVLLPRSTALEVPSSATRRHCTGAVCVLYGL